MSDGGGIVELRGNVGAIAFARLTRVPHSGRKSSRKLHYCAAAC